MTESEKGKKGRKCNERMKERTKDAWRINVKCKRKGKERLGGEM